MTSSDEEIAQEFGNNFGSVFTRETDNKYNYSNCHYDVTGSQLSPLRGAITM